MLMFQFDYFVFDIWNVIYFFGIDYKLGISVFSGVIEFLKFLYLISGK